MDKRKWLVRLEEVLDRMLSSNLNVQSQLGGGRDFFLASASSTNTEATHIASFANYVKGCAALQLNEHGRLDNQKLIEEVRKKTDDGFLNLVHYICEVGGVNVDQLTKDLACHFTGVSSDGNWENFFLNMVSYWKRRRDASFFFIIGRRAEEKVENLADDFNFLVERVVTAIDALNKKTEWGEALSSDSSNRCIVDILKYEYTRTYIILEARGSDAEDEFKALIQSPRGEDDPDLDAVMNLLGQFRAPKIEVIEDFAIIIKECVNRKRPTSLLRSVHKNVSSQQIACGMKLDDFKFRLSVYFTGTNTTGAHWEDEFTKCWSDWMEPTGRPDVALEQISEKGLCSALNHVFSVTHEVMFGERDEVINNDRLTSARKSERIEALNSRLAEGVRIRCIQSVMRYQRNQIYAAIRKRGDESLVTFEAGLLKENEYNLEFFKVMTRDLHLEKATISSRFVDWLARGLANQVTHEVTRIYTFKEKLQSHNASTIANRMRPLFSPRYNELKQCVDDYAGEFETHFIKLFVNKITAWRKFCEELLQGSMRLDGTFPPDERNPVLQPVIDEYYNALVTAADNYLQSGYWTVMGKSLAVVAAQTRGLFQTLKSTAAQQNVEMKVVNETLLRYFNDISEFWGHYFEDVWRIHKTQNENE